MKGLKRSLSRGEPALQEVFRLDVPIKADITITGVHSTTDVATFPIAGLPPGNLLFLGAVAYVQVDGTDDANIVDNWDGDFSIGTDPQNDVDLGDAAEINIIPATALASGGSDKLAPSTRSASTSSEHGVILDNTDGSMELNFNLLIDDNVITDAEDGVFEVRGSLHAAFIVLGDD